MINRSNFCALQPSGPLTTLPFHVLITMAPDIALNGMDLYRKAAWLALQQPVTVLPSVVSLQALRQLPPSQAQEPYIAFGNLLLLGSRGIEKSAWGLRVAISHRASQRNCPAWRLPVRHRSHTAARTRTSPGNGRRALRCRRCTRRSSPTGRDRVARRAGHRAQPQGPVSPGRACALQGAALCHAWSARRRGRSDPQSQGRTGADSHAARGWNHVTDLEEDDGLLTASEVAQLELDADWIVLSACNTAAGDKGDAEALSGLARAFFYAKARALLVSHWPVNSDAAVKLTTRAFAELGANPQIGRAEALRRSMAELITNGAPHEAHPANWAPFVLVGEGTR